MNNKSNVICTGIKLWCFKKESCEHPKQSMIKYIEENNLQPKCFIVCAIFGDDGNKYNHAFTYFNTWVDFLESRSNLMQFDKPSQKRKGYVYEIIREGLKSKPYLDVEHVYESEEEMKHGKNEFLNKVITDIIKVFHNEYIETIEPDDIAIAEASRKKGENGFKLSFHIIVSPVNKNILFNTNIILSPSQMSSSPYHFYTSLLRIDEIYYENFLDGGVYDWDKNYRMLWSYKDYKDVVKFASVLYPSFEKSNSKSGDFFLKYVISYEDTTKPTILLQK